MKKYAFFAPLFGLWLASSSLYAQNATTFAQALSAAQNQNGDQNQAAQNPSDDPSQAPSATPPDPNAQGDGVSLMDTLSPSDDELSEANVRLLAENAALSRQVDDLTVQVNVLIQERSGQLFAYGAATAIAAVAIGFALARLFGQKRW